MITPVIGRPGIQTGNTVNYRQIFAQPEAVLYVPGGGIIDKLSLDPGNTGSPGTLRAGLLMGRDSSSGKWKPTISGVSQNAYTSGGTTITITPAQALALVARNAASTGNLYYIGPPTANGTNAVTGPIAFSAVNVGTGAITVSTLGVNKVAGTLVVLGDGSEVPRSVIPDGSGVQMVPANAADVDFPQIAYDALLQSAQIIDWPTDTSIQAYIMASMNPVGAAGFKFDHLLKA